MGWDGMGWEDGMGKEVLSFSRCLRRLWWPRAGRRVRIRAPVHVKGIHALPEKNSILYAILYGLIL